MSPNLPLLYLYAARRAPHEAAYIMGTRKGIRALIAVLMTALERGVGQAELSAGAHNPYTVPALTVYDQDSPI